MEYEMKPYIVYAKLDDSNCITAVNSSAFLRDTNGWTEIDSGYSDKNHHPQGNYFAKPIMDERGIHRYKAKPLADIPEGCGMIHAFECDGVEWAVYERSAEEMDADYAALPPPPLRDHELLREALAALTAIEEGIASV